MTIVTIASYIVAAVLALSRILSVTKPYWAFLPTWAAALIPTIIAAVPIAVDKFSSVHSGLDFVTSLIVVGALFLPGAGVPHPDAIVTLPPAPPAQ